MDVGANDPLIGSVTKFFYDRGANGINIEPQQEHTDHLKTARPRDINLAVGISNKAGELTLYGNGAHASFDRNNQRIKQEIAHVVPVVTLSEVFNKYVFEDEDIHFLKINADGWEGKCLEGMDFIRFRPWILCIESTLPCTTTSCHETWEELVLEQNYVFLGDTCLNRYYAAAERLQEIQEFCHPEQLDALYNINEDKGLYLFDESIVPILQKQKVLLFGAGKVGQAYWRQAFEAGLQFESWIASRPKKGLPVKTLECLDELEYDVILIAVREEYVEEVREILSEHGVPCAKILWKPFLDLVKTNNYIYSFKRYGKNITMYLPHYGEDYIQSTLVLSSNFYESDELKYLRKAYLKGGNVILDIGANIGNHTVFFSKICNAERIYAFEPITETYDTLCRNIDLNHIEDRVVAYNVALGDVSGRAKIKNFPLLILAVRR